MERFVVGFGWLALAALSAFAVTAVGHTLCCEAPVQFAHDTKQ